MKTPHKIFLINIGIMTCYHALIWTYFYQPQEHQAKIGIVILLAFALGAHILLAFMIGTHHHQEKNRVAAKAWYLSMLLILLVGFSFCFGGASVVS